MRKFNEILESINDDIKYELENNILPAGSKIYNVESTKQGGKVYASIQADAETRDHIKGFAKGKKINDYTIVDVDGDSEISIILEATITKNEMQELKDKLVNIIKSINNLNLKGAEYQEPVLVSSTFQFHTINVNTKIRAKDAILILQTINKQIPVIDVSCRLIQQRDYQRGKFKDDGVTYVPGPSEKAIANRLNGANHTMETDPHAINLYFDSYQDAIKGLENQNYIDSMNILIDLDTSALYQWAHSKGSPHVSPDSIDLTEFPDVYEYTQVARKAR